MRLLEILFDGKQEADDMLMFVLGRSKEAEAKEVEAKKAEPQKEEVKVEAPISEIQK